MATQTTIDLKLYERSTIQCLYPSPQEQQVVSQLIREIAGGKVEESQAEEIRKIIFQIHGRDPFDGVIIACTELPLIHRKMPLSDTLQVVDTIEVLAKQMIKLALSD